MNLQNISAMLLEGGYDATGVASIITILLGVSTIVGVLITYILVRPMVTKVKDEIMEKIDEMAAGLVSKDVFDAFCEADKNEHEGLNRQISRLYSRLDHTRD